MWQLFLHLSDGYLLTMAAWLVVLALTPVVLVRLRRKWTAQKSRLRFVYASLSTWLCFGLLTLPELGFALLYDTTDSFDMTNVSNRWFQVHVEPEVRTLEFVNDTGISYRNDSDIVLSPEDDVRHVCFLGDSFTFGHGVAKVGDRFSNRVFRSMDSELSSSIEVSNLAWPGTDLLWTESVIKHSFESGGRIDDAVYVLCLNDIEAFHDPTMSRSSSLAHFEPPTFLFRDTYFFNWLFFRTQLLLQSETRGYYSFVKEYYEGEPWQRFREALASMADCEDFGIDSFDLDPALSEHSDERLTVNPFDAHPNERAHEIAAEALTRWLSDKAEDSIGHQTDSGQSLERPIGD